MMNTRAKIYQAYGIDLVEMYDRWILNNHIKFESGLVGVKDFYEQLPPLKRKLTPKVFSKDWNKLINEPYWLIQNGYAQQLFFKQESGDFICLSVEDQIDQGHITIER